jgi:hypothetical protein
MRGLGLVDYGLNEDVVKVCDMESTFGNMHFLFSCDIMQIVNVLCVVCFRVEVAVLCQVGSEW